MNFKFDRTKFLTGLREKFGKLDANQLRGFTFLLDRIETGSHFTTLPQIAYFLATAWHETARTMQPIVERGPRAYFRKYDIGNLAKRLGNTPEEDGDGFKFRGRGYVQNTGMANALTAGRALSGRYYEDKAGAKFMVQNGTFLDNPDLLLIPAVSYDDAIDGMFTGRYTGRSIQDYINSKKKDYRGARRVINGTDQDLLIAGYAEKFEAILQASLVQFDVKVSASNIAKPGENPPSASVTVEIDENKTSGVSVKDLAKHVSPGTFKAVGPKVAAKAGSATIMGLTTIWQLGLHGQILVIALLVLVVIGGGIVVYEVIKHRKKIKDVLVSFIKGDPVQPTT